MNATEITATKEKILAAAVKVFVEKGKDGARMQEIADRAQANKAMIYYYYTSKDMLYEEVLKSIFSKIFTMIGHIMISEGDAKTKLEQVVSAYINFISRNPELPRIILREFASGGETLRKIIRQLQKENQVQMPASVLSAIQKSIERGEFRAVDPGQTMLSIIGMSVIYFIARPVIQVILGLEGQDEKNFLEERKKSIVDLLEHGLLHKGEKSA